MNADEKRKLVLTAPERLKAEFAALTKNPQLKASMTETVRKHRELTADKRAQRA